VRFKGMFSYPVLNRFTHNSRAGRGRMKFVDPELHRRR
jgi:hypothetical protein